MSGKLQLEPLFQGGTTVAAQRALRQFLGESPGIFDLYVVPCVGNFTIVEQLLDMGIAPEQIETGDITLYTGLMGALVDPQRTIEELGFSLLSPELEALIGPILATQFATDPEIKHAAAIMFAIKWAQLNPKRDYLKWRRVEMVRQIDAVIGAYAQALTSFAERCKGVAYRAMDVHKQIDEVRDRPGTLVWYSPPWYSGGYTKMFDPKGAYTWKPPEIPEMQPKDVPPCLNGLAHADACVLGYIREGPAYDALDTEQWDALCVEMDEKTRTRVYMLANKHGETGVVVRRKFRPSPTKVPLVYDGHEITAESKLAFVKTDQDVALYFYDLFVRELGFTKAEVYYLFTIDGQVVATVGFDLRSYFRTREPRLYETFGICCTSERYARLGRLMRMGTTSRAFIDQFLAENVSPGLLLPPLKEYQTTCLSRHPNAVSHRGLLKRVSKEALKNGRFHLIYRTDVYERDLQAVLDEWMKKHAHKGRKT